MYYYSRVAKWFFLIKFIIWMDHQANPEIIFFIIELTEIWYEVLYLKMYTVHFPSY